MLERLCPYTIAVAVGDVDVAAEAFGDVAGVGDAGLRLRRYTIGGTAVAVPYVMEVPRGEYSGIIILVMAVWCQGSRRKRCVSQQQGGRRTIQRPGSPGY